MDLTVEYPKNESETSHHKNLKTMILSSPWMILGAKFRSWANFPWFFQKRDSLF
jgi:hypothetical protein